LLAILRPRSCCFTQGALEACKTDFVARAVDAGQLYIVKLYLNCFAYLDHQYRDEEGSLLHRASAASCLIVVEYLLSHGLVDVTVRSNEGLDPLHRGVRSDHSEISAFLISCGADVMAFDSRSHTPLAVSSFENHVSTAQLLLDYEKKLGVNSPHKEEAWRRAAKGGHIAMVKLLVQHEQAGTGSAGSYPVLAEALTSEKPNAAAVAHLLIIAGALAGHQLSL
jgi:ankyrin repeat protein